MISIFNDAGERLPIVFDADLFLNTPINGDPLHILEINAVFIKDVFSGTTEPRPTADGTEIYSVRKNAKLIRLDGIARAPTFAALSDLNEEMRGKLDPARLSQTDVIGHGVTPLEFTALSTAGEMDSYIICRPVGTPDYLMDQYLGKNCPFRIELFAADPRRYLLAADVYTLTGSDSDSLANEGNYPSIPEIEITMAGAGSATYTLTNQTLDPDGSIVLNLSSMIAGDLVEVYPNEKVVLKNGNRADNLVTAATTWGMIIRPGLNTVNVVNGTNTTTEITVFHAFST